MLALFIFAALAYGAASFAFGADRQDSSRRWSWGLLAVAAALHTGTIGAQCTDGTHPFSSVFLAMSFGVLLTVGGFLLLSARRTPMRALGAVLSPVGLVGLTVGVVAGPQVSTSTELPAAIVTTHIAAAVVGVAGFALAAGVAGLYLAMERRLRSKEFRPRQGGMSLVGLDRLHYRIVLFMTPVFTVAIVTGAIAILRQGDALWHERPVELAAALVAWLASVVALGSRAVWGVRGRKAAALTMVAFASMVLIVVSYGVRT